MRLQIQCDVEADTFLEETITIERPDRTFSFHPDKSGILSKIAITADVPDPEKFYSEIRHIPGKPTQIIRSRDEDLYESVIRDFQEIESLMTPILQMRKVHWENNSYQLIIESEDERARVGLSGWTLTPGEPIRELFPASKSAFEAIISSKSTAQILIVPMAFYREGCLDFESKRYINAFFNFYFVLEGLYGKGKTADHQIRDEFLKTPALKQVVGCIINDAEMFEPKDKEGILAMLNRRTFNYDFAGIVGLIVKTRGDLHHFTNNPNRIQGSPFTQANFRPVAILIRTICFLTIAGYFTLDGNQRAT